MAPLSFGEFAREILALDTKYMGSKKSLLGKVVERYPCEGVDGTAEVDELEVVDIALLTEELMEEKGLGSLRLVGRNDIGWVRRIGDIYMMVCREKNIVPDFSRE